jgi:Family of unknown function (DUF5759)
MSNVEVPKLEPRNLFEKRVARDNARLRAYNQLLKQIHVRISGTAALPGNPNYLIYTIPPFIIGLPALDLQDCVVYIVYQLRTSGFEVRFTYPNLLYISWKQYEQEYMRERNPIAVAMKPEATTKKGAGGKRGTAADSAQHVTFAPDLSRIGGVAAPAKSVKDYRPPDTFVQNLQRPTDSAKRTDSILEELWKF